MSRICNVKYQIATYSGTIKVTAEDDDDSNTIKAKAKSKLRRQSGGTLPFGYESFEIMDEEDNDDDDNAY